MAAQWDIQQALAELRVEMNGRFDKLEAARLSDAIDNARLEGRIGKLEEKAGWIGAGIGASFVAIFGLFLTILKTKMGF